MEASWSEKLSGWFGNTKKGNDSDHTENTASTIASWISHVIQPEQQQHIQENQHQHVTRDGEEVNSGWTFNFSLTAPEGETPKFDESGSNHVPEQRPRRRSWFWERNEGEAKEEKEGDEAMSKVEAEDTKSDLGVGRKRSSSWFWDWEDSSAADPQKADSTHSQVGGKNVVVGRSWSWNFTPGVKKNQSTEAGQAMESKSTSWLSYLIHLEKNSEQQGAEESQQKEQQDGWLSLIMGHQDQQSKENQEPNLEILLR